MGVPTLWGRIEVPPQDEGPRFLGVSPKTGSPHFGIVGSAAPCPPPHHPKPPNPDHQPSRTPPSIYGAHGEVGAVGWGVLWGGR